MPKAKRYTDATLALFYEWVEERCEVHDADVSESVAMLIHDFKRFCDGRMYMTSFAQCMRQTLELCGFGFDPADNRRCLGIRLRPARRPLPYPTDDVPSPTATEECDPMQPLLRWLEDNCNVNPGYRMREADAYRDYSAWMTQKEIPPRPRKFYELMEKAGFRKFKSNGLRYLVGLTLKPIEERLQQHDHSRTASWD